ncbi:unnamed protein product [Clavelina lepadiformis]|uniref:Uncharacterized protein n=1 Tax=Clavelina lepadiformis TaxID=159417 RepID=A0ABP0GEB8_CLALP
MKTKMNESDTILWLTRLGIGRVYSSRTYRAMQQRRNNLKRTESGHSTRAQPKRHFDQASDYMVENAFREAHAQGYAYGSKTKVFIEMMVRLLYHLDAQKQITTDKRSRSRKLKKRPIAEKKHSSSEEETQPEIKKKNPVLAVTSNLTPASVTQVFGERRGVERPKHFTRSCSQTADKYNKGKAHDEDVELNDVASCNDDSSSGYYSKSSEDESNVMEVEGQTINILESKFSSHYQFGPAEDKETDDVVLQDYIPIQTSIIIGDWASTVKLGGCEIKFPAGAVDKCTMVAFTLTYLDEDDDKLFFYLTGLRRSHSDPNTYMFIMTEKGKTWTELCEEKCTDNWVTFETESFSGKKATTKRRNVGEKEMCFKFSRSAKRSADSIIECKIVNGYVDTSDEECFFKLKVNKDHDLKLTFQCENAKVESRVVYSEEIFCESPVILTEFKFIKNNDLGFDALTFKVKSKTTKKELKRFPFPPKFLLAQDENIDDTIEKIKTMTVKELNVLHAIKKHYYDHIGNEEIYQIRSKPKGRALILSNAKFDWRPPDGEAEAKFIAKSNEECSLMKKLFEDLGCEVNVERNKSAKEMLEVVQSFATRSDHTNYSILFVMTHGAKMPSDNQSGTLVDDVLVGSDRAYIKSGDIVEMFCADKVNTNLMNKPRLIFIESCRGGLRIGTEEADMLIAHSTKDGFPAFQRWFTDAIAWYFSQHAKDTEIMPLLRKVRNYVSQRTYKSSSRPELDGKKQCPIDKTGLLKDLYFFPGIYPD